VVAPARVWEFKSPPAHMKREEVAQAIQWPTIIWCIGILNPLFLLPQLWTVWASESTEGISLVSFVIMFAIQTGFSSHGFFMRDRPLMLSNGGAAFVTFVTVASVLYFRF
jgi:uncharacterized protein with PQ loop repeat